MTGSAAPAKMSAADREREAREAAIRRRKLSIRLGSLGVLLLFLGGVGVILEPAYVAELLAVMVLGVLLVVAALLLVLSLVWDVTKIT